MRITKVKVDKKDVIMQRDTQEGYLKFGDDIKRDRTIQDVFDAKRASFLESVLNKTVVKKPQFDKLEGTEKEKSIIKKQRASNIKQIRIIFEYILYKNEPNFNEREFAKNFNTKFLKDLNEDELLPYLGHKFRQKIEYKNTFISKLEFTLPNDLIKALKKYKGAFNSVNELKEISNELYKYSKWSKWYINNKQIHLKKSIINNKIDYQGDFSPRKKALAVWANTLVNNYSIDFTCLIEQFGLVKLLTEWNKIFENETKQTEADVLKQNQLINNTEKNKKPPKPLNPKNNGIPVDLFEFKRKLKSCLQSHQRNILDALKNDPILNQYSLEVTKYLELYFPLKKSNKRLSESGIKYYLKFNTIKNRIESQIVNATMQYLIQQGKAINYESNTSVDSDQLRDIKTQETFALKFINACAFAANNLRNCIDPNQTKDIIGRDCLVESLRKFYEKSPIFYSNEAKINLSQFFFLLDSNNSNQVTSTHKDIIDELNRSDDSFLEFVFSIRGAIQAVRNNIIHYKKQSLNIALNINDFELIKYDDLNRTVKKPKSTNPSPVYSNSYLSKLLENELKQLSHLFSEKIKTSGAFDYYNLEILKKHFSKPTLYSKPLSFTPGFKKIFSWGLKYQKDSFSGLELKKFFNKAYNANDHINLDLKFEARYNILSLIYEQRFIPDFFSDEILFSNSVNQVLQANKKRAEINKNKNAWAFHEITPFFIPDSLQEEDIIESRKRIIIYLQNIQGQLIQEENKKRDENTLSETDTGHFQQFLWQVFLKGFDTYLNQSQWKFIENPCDQFIGCTKIERANKQNECAKLFKKNIQIDYKINSSDNKQIAFWTLCKMLNSQHLNELHNQFTKWSQSKNKLVTDVDLFQEIIQVCLLSADRVPNSWEAIYANHDDCLKTITPYTDFDIKTIRDKKELYVQEDETPVVFSHIELVKKYATFGILSKVIGKKYEDNNHNIYYLTVSTTDLESWDKQRQEAACWATDRQFLHDDWANSLQKKTVGKPYQKNYTEGWDNKKYLNGNITNKYKYIDLNKKLDQYNWLDNKVHLVHVKNLHHLLIEILGRMVGFVALWERDFRFLHKKILSNQFFDTQYELSDNLDIQDYNDQYKDFLYSIFLNSENVDRPNSIKNNKGTWKDERNHIAHFNYLTEGDPKFSLLDLLSHIRSLVSYDRKLKNSVAKAFIDLLEKHGILIEFKPLYDNDHCFIIKSIKPKQINHLGSDKIQSNQVHPEYVQMVQALLEHKSEA